MKNPSSINQPKLKSPIGKKNKQGKKIGKNGNLPYLKYRRKLRKEMFRF